jgi:hypothetical protein
LDKEIIMAQPRTIYQFRAELENFKPKIWRLYEVSEDVTVARLAYTTMVLFEMDASHLYCVDLIRKGAEEVHFALPICTEWDIHDKYIHINPAKFKLKDVTDTPGSIFRLSYDFGDCWEIAIKLKKVFVTPNFKKADYPRVIDGEGYGIIEDCGGVWGLGDIVKAFQDKKGKMYNEFSHFLGTKDFDITKFDIKKMNVRLKHEPEFFDYAYQ